MYTVTQQGDNRYYETKKRDLEEDREYRSCNNVFQ